MKAEPIQRGLLEVEFEMKLESGRHVSWRLAVLIGKRETKLNQL